MIRWLRRSLLPVLAVVAAISSPVAAQAAPRPSAAVVQATAKEAFVAATPEEGAPTSNSVIRPPAGGQGLSSVEISSDLNCSMTIPDDTQGEFFQGTACATLVSVDGKIFGPKTIPAFAMNYQPNPYSKVSQDLSGDGSRAHPFVIATVVDLPGTGIELTQTDSYTTGIYSYDTSITVRNVNGATHHVLVYRAADCYLGGSDTGFGAIAQGMAACVSEAAGNGSNVAGSRKLTFAQRDLMEAHRMEGDFRLVWQKTIAGQAFPDTADPTDLDNGAGLSWEIGYLSAGDEYTFKSAITVDPIMAGHKSCSEEQLTGSMKSGDGAITVTYDPRFLWPENDPKYLTYANAMASLVADWAAADRTSYAALGFNVPPSITIQVNCAIKIYDQIGVSADGFTERADLFKLKADFLRTRMAQDAKDKVDGKPASPGYKPWANVVDHELVHTFQYMDVDALWGLHAVALYVNYAIAGDNVNMESGATAGSDLLPNRDDDGSWSNDDAGSYLLQTNNFMGDPTPVDASSAGAYKAAAFLQYLGEHYGDKNLNAHPEQKVRDFLQRMLKSGTHTDALAAAMSRSNNGAVSAALRDFMVAAYVQRAGNLGLLDSKYWIYDEIIGHDKPIGSQPAVVPQYANLNANAPQESTWPHTIPVPSIAFTPDAWEIPLIPGQTAVHVKVAGRGDGPIQYAFVPMTASGDVVVNELKAGIRDVGAGTVEFDVQVVGASKVGVLLATDLSNPLIDFLAGAPYQASVTLSVVSGTATLTVDPIADISGSPAAQLRGFPVQLSVTNGSAPIRGIDIATFGLQVDGGSTNHVRATGFESNPGLYRLTVWTATPLGPGWHTLEVNLGNATTSVDFNVQPAGPPPNSSVAASAETDGPGDGLVGVDGTGTADTSSIMYVASSATVGDPLPVRLALMANHYPLAGATVDVTVTTPSGAHRHARLEDSGGALDGCPDDGIYGGYVWGTDASGTYTIRVDATDTAGGAGIVQTATATIDFAGTKLDSDADGMSDAAEGIFSLDALQPADAAKDADGDGLTNADEIARGTNPLIADTDAGGELDGAEVAAGRDPTLASDDVQVPEVVLRVTPLNGRIFSVVVGALDGQTSVHLWRRDATGQRTDLGVHPATGDTVTDGPLALGQYWYEAEVGSAQSPSLAASAGPYQALDHATPPSVRIDANAGRAFANSTTTVISFLDVTGGPTEMRLAESETALAASPWVPFAGQTVFGLSGTTDLSVYAQVRDAFGLDSAVASVPVQFDTTAPVSAAGTMPAEIAAGPIGVPFTVSDGVDLGSGVAKVELWARYRPLDSQVFGPWVVVGLQDVGVLAALRHQRRCRPCLRIPDDRNRWRRQSRGRPGGS